MSNLVVRDPELYPACHYLLRGSDWNPASFDPQLVLDGYNQSRAAAGHRILDPAGGIYVLGASPFSSATLDASFVAIEGMEVKCLRPFGSPRFRVRQDGTFGRVNSVAQPGKAAISHDAGYALLQESLVWGSSLGASTTVIGPGALSASTLLGLSGTQLNLSAATDINGGANGVLLLPTTDAGAHTVHYGWGSTIPVGTRMKLTFKWKRSAIVTGQASTVAVIEGNQGSLVYFSSTSGGLVAVPGTSGLTHNSQAHMWPRSDGWMLCELTWYQEQQNAGFRFYVCNNNGSTSYTPDGTTGVVVCDVVFSEVRATTLTNLSTVIGAATITGGDTTAPMLEDSVCPEDGWWPDGSPALRFLGGESRILSFSSPAYTGISGTAHPVSMSWLWAPYQAATADATIWNFAGSASLLKVEHTTASKLKVTRTTDAGASANVTFDHTIGFVPQASSVVLDGTNAKLYIQDRLIETKALSLSGAANFTSGGYGGALSARSSEFSLSGSALTVSQVQQIHAKLAHNRGWRIDPIPVWLLIAQSNGMALADATTHTTFGPASLRRPCVHYEMGTPAGVSWDASQVVYSGWGPTRDVHPKFWGDGPWPMFGAGGRFHNWSQYVYGHEVGFANAMGYVATIRFAVGNTAIDEFLPGGVQNANMLAALTDAFATIGISYFVQGIVLTFGESNANDLSLANVYGTRLQSLVDHLCAEFNLDQPCVVMNKLHASSGYPYLWIVRSHQESFVADRSWAGLCSVDDFVPLPNDIIHWRVNRNSEEYGERCGAVAQRLIGQRGLLQPSLNQTTGARLI